MMYNGENAVENKVEAAVGETVQPAESAIELRVAQINLRVADYAAMKDFYTQVLCESARETSSSEDRDVHACVFELPNVNLVLIHQPSASGGQELVFGLGENEAVEAIYSRLKRVPGCKQIQFPHYALDNRYEAIFEDPEGNELIFRD